VVPLNLFEIVIVLIFSALAFMIFMIINKKQLKKAHDLEKDIRDRNEEV